VLPGKKLLEPGQIGTLAMPFCYKYIKKLEKLLIINLNI
jgi:hypothetical protein